jgi:hypothetical protein
MLWSRGSLLGCVALGSARIKEKHPEQHDYRNRHNNNQNLKCAVAVVRPNSKVSLKKIQHRFAPSKPPLAHTAGIGIGAISVLRNWTLGQLNVAATGRPLNLEEQTFAAHQSMSALGQ